MLRSSRRQNICLEIKLYESVDRYFKDGLEKGHLSETLGKALHVCIGLPGDRACGFNDMLIQKMVLYRAFITYAGNLFIQICQETEHLPMKLYNYVIPRINYKVLFHSFFYELTCFDPITPELLKQTVFFDKHISMVYLTIEKGWLANHKSDTNH